MYKFVNIKMPHENSFMKLSLDNIKSVFLNKTERSLLVTYNDGTEYWFAEKHSDNEKSEFEHIVSDVECLYSQF